MKNLIVLISLAVCCLFSTATFSQTTFTGAISNDWADAGNWSNGLPAVGNDAAIPAGATVVVIDIGLTIDFNIDNDGAINLAQDAAINNYGDLNIFEFGTISNEGYLYNFGTITNNGAITSIGAIANEGTITNNGTVTNDGYIGNLGIINNVGTIFNYGGNLEFGGINNNGTITNDGVIEQCDNWLGEEPINNPYTTENCPGNGCTDIDACNYDTSATSDDNSCVYVEGICDTCSGETDGTGVVVDNDADDDGVCDDDEIVGCQDPDACNYDPLATDEGECYYMPVYSIEGSLFTSAFDLEFYTYTNSEGSTYAWTCTGCAIQTGNGTSSVGLVWGEEGINELCVQETDSTGCVGELICVDVAVTATNVENIDGDHFTIYPNPASTSITISTDAALLNSPYRITDVQGKLVMEGALRNTTTVLNTDHLSNGQYTLTIIAEETVITKPLIIQK